MKKHKDVKKNDSFLGITSVNIKETPIGLEIVAEFRYKCEDDDVVTFVIELPNRTKTGYTYVNPTNGEIAATTSKAVILPKMEVERGKKFILKAQLGEGKATIAFSILHNKEVIHS